MAHEPLGREEIQSKFIFPGDYATPGLLPGALVVLSQVSIYYGEDSLSMVAIHRNDTEQNAETKLLQLLNDISCHTKEIDIGIIQNFSPCNDGQNDEFCAKGIVDYKNKMKHQGTKIDISVTFANFYENIAEQNRKGLRLMYDNGVRLRLLCGREEWRKFLNDDQLVSLSADDLEECWNLALSAKRHGWEKRFRSDFWEIL